MNICDRTNLLAVMDGHGEHGGEVSEFLLNEMPVALGELLKRHMKGRTDSNVLREVSKQFLKIDSKLVGPKYLNSGSTATACIQAGDVLVLAALGDSRAVLGSVGQSPGTYVATLLSFDHKADRPEEQSRIIKAGGEVHPIYSHGRQFGPARLFKRGEEYPGLAVSRAFGDRLSKEIGVVAEPELAVHELSPEDRCVVLCSDGVWDQLTNEEAVRLAMAAATASSDPHAPALAICKEARRRWERGLKTGGEGSGSIDDITAVVGILLPCEVT